MSLPVKQSTAHGTCRYGAHATTVTGLPGAAGDVNLIGKPAPRTDADGTPTEIDAAGLSLRPAARDGVPGGGEQPGQHAGQHADDAG
jgi:hypothetical protein